MSAEAQNLKAIYDAIDRHDKECEYPAIEIRMSPFEVERLDWDSIRGLPIVGDETLPTGVFRIVCDASNDEDEYEIEAVGIVEEFLGV